MTQDGYGKAYRQGFVRTVRLLLSRGASVDNAEDVAQAAWLRGWQKREQLRDDKLVTSWVNTIALNYHRRGSQQEARYQTLPEFCGQVELDLAPLDAAKVLTLCHPRDRVIFEQQLTGFTTKEIAKEQGISETAIRIRISRARRAVREDMEGHRVRRVGTSI